MRCFTRSLAAGSLAPVAVLLIGSVFVAPLGGCLVSSSNSTVESGIMVTTATLDQVAPHQTTSDWLIATLGQPTTRVDVEGQPGVQIWRYDYSRTERSAGAVFLIFGGATKRQETSRAFFEVSQGVVTRAWREG